MADLNVQITLTARNQTDRAVRQAEQGINRLRRGGRKLSKLDVANRAARDVNELSANLSRTGNQLDRLGRRGRAAIGSIITPTVDYGNAVAEVSTLVEGGAADQAEIRKETQALAAEFGSLPTDQAAALYQVISSGAKLGADSTEILTTANKLAVGGVTDVETAADGLTSIINAYGLEASDAASISDTLFVTMRAGKTTIGELSSNVGKVAAIAANANTPIEQVGAALAALTASGKNTNIATTELRSVLTAIEKPSRGLTGSTKRLSKTLQKDLAEGGVFQAVKRIKEMREAGELSDKQFNRLFSNVRARSGVLTLAGKGFATLDKTLTKAKDGAGETDTALAKVTDTFGFRAKKAEADLELLKIQIGEELLPVVADLLKEFTPLIKEFSEFVRDNPTMVKELGKLAIGVVGVATVLAPLLQTISAVSGVVGAFRVARMVKGLTDIEAASGSASAASGKLSGKLGGVNSALLVAGAAIAGYQLGKAIDETFQLSTRIEGLITSLTGLDEELDRLEDKRTTGFAKNQAEQIENEKRALAESRAALEEEEGFGLTEAAILATAPVSLPLLLGAEAAGFATGEGDVVGGTLSAKGDALRSDIAARESNLARLESQQAAGQSRAALVVRVEDNRTATVQVEEATGVDVDADTGSQ